MSYPHFRRLHLSGWRQFQNVNLEFHPKLTVITGANGAGKSSLLGILTQHFGWQKMFLGTPLKKRVNGVARALSGLRRFNAIGYDHEVGAIEYTDNGVGSIRTVAEALQYSITIANQRQVLGTYITSHRSPPTFQQVSNINASALSVDQAYNQYQNEAIQRSLGQYHGPSPIFRLKESIVSMAHFGAHTEYSDGDPAALEVIRGFSRILKKTLPSSLGFIDISIRTTDIVLETETGNFLMDAASGGVMAIIDLSWQIYIYSLTSIAKAGPDFTVVMDEPENHLHPSMQRALLSSLIDAFPNAQFIVATHSPFMVSSVKDSFVYALRYGPAEKEAGVEVDDGRPFTQLVYSERLDVVNRAGSASDILRDVLGVPVTLPIWVESELERVVENFRGIEINSASLGALRAELSRLGFGELYPQALSRILDAQ